MLMNGSATTWGDCVSSFVLVAHELQWSMIQQNAKCCTSGNIGSCNTCRLARGPFIFVGEGVSTSCGQYDADGQYAQVKQAVKLILLSLIFPKHLPVGGSTLLVEICEQILSLNVANSCSSQMMCTQWPLQGSDITFWNDLLLLNPFFFISLAQSCLVQTMRQQTERWCHTFQDGTKEGCMYRERSYISAEWAKCKVGCCCVCNIHLQPLHGSTH